MSRNLLDYCGECNKRTYHEHGYCSICGFLTNAPHDMAKQFGPIRKPRHLRSLPRQLDKPKREASENAWQAFFRNVRQAIK